MDAKIYNFMGNAFFSSPAVLGAFLRQPVILCPRNSVSPPLFLNPRPKSRSCADILYLCRLPFMTSSFLRCISCPCDASYVHTLSAFVFQLDVSFYAFASLGALSVQSRELSNFFRLNIRGLPLLHFLPSPYVHVSRERERVVVVSAFHPSSWPLLPLSPLSSKRWGGNLSVPCL